MVDPIVCTIICMGCSIIAYFVGYVLGKDNEKTKLMGMFNILKTTGEFPLGDEKLLLVKRERR
tara:strand:+ start:186 stop:374 length:189 start_codon:yes stop_codon:yes gene_type:complete